jgi:hypothetical protein
MSTFRRSPVTSVLCVAPPPPPHLKTSAKYTLCLQFVPKIVTVLPIYLSEPGSSFYPSDRANFAAVLRIRPDPDQLVQGTDPDPSIIKQK